MKEGNLERVHRVREAGAANLEGGRAELVALLIRCPVALTPNYKRRNLRPKKSRSIHCGRREDEIKSTEEIVRILQGKKPVQGEM